MNTKTKNVSRETLRRTMSNLAHRGQRIADKADDLSRLLSFPEGHRRYVSDDQMVFEITGQLDNVVAPIQVELTACVEALDPDGAIRKRIADAKAAAAERAA